jgi:hypothetical protein
MGKGGDYDYAKVNMAMVMCDTDVTLNKGGFSRFSYEAPP